MDHHEEPKSQGAPPFPDELFSGGTGSRQGGTWYAPPKRQRLSGRLIALCLVCALLGGISGGAAVFLSGLGGNTAVYQGSRTPVTLETVSRDTSKEMSPAEVYATNVNACVGISVDTITTNIFGQTVKGAAAGSGFVVSEDGYIVTNQHVVDDAKAITVTFVDGASYPAVYVGGDRQNDIAVIKINAKDLTPVILGDSAQMHVGETVLTIGNPLGELTFSLSDGVVSAVNRSIAMSDGSRRNMIQTNCTINSGNSGGPLFNLYGEVIGIVSAKYSTPAGTMLSGTASVEGLGFAIPISDVYGMITDLISKGYISGRPFLGISMNTVSREVQAYGIPAGAQVIYVTPGLAAAKGGIQEGDVITTVGETPIASNTELSATVNEHKAGDVLPFTIFRKGETLTISVTLGERTAEAVEANTAYQNKRDAQQKETDNSSPQPNQEQEGGYYWPFF
jgi:serine protease Do